MKKQCYTLARQSLFLIAFVTLFIGCSKTNSPDPLTNGDSTKEVERFFVSQQDAVSLLESVGEDNSSSRRLSLSEGKAKRKVKRMTPYKDDDGQIICYIATYDNDEGWTILSADRRTIPVIAFGDKGSFEDEISNPGAKVWLNVVKDGFKSAKKAKEQSPEAIALWKKYDDQRSGRVQVDPSQCELVYQNLPSNIQISHLTDQHSRWSQGEGYNYFSPSRSCGPCGKALTGCGPIAVAQVLRYHKKPITFNGFSFTNAIYEGMPQVITGGCNPNTNEQNAARLISMAAAGLSTDYNATSCQSWNIPGNTDDFFSSLGFTSYDRDFHTNGPLIASELQAYRPLVIFGTPGSFNFWEGHIWVIDGYLKEYYVANVYCLNPNPNEPRLSATEQVNATCCEARSLTYYQMNWGWGRADINNNWYSTSVDISEGGTTYTSYMKVYVVQP